MPSGPGFWRNLKDGALYRVTAHDRWMLDPENPAKVGLMADAADLNTE
jgi:hypothetical protein